MIETKKGVATLYRFVCNGCGKALDVMWHSIGQPQTTNASAPLAAERHGWSALQSFAWCPDCYGTNPVAIRMHRAIRRQRECREYARAKREEQQAKGRP